jgi:MOSC domain-containing protein YiiM
MAPAEGVVVQISVSKGGLPKRPVPEVLITELGLQGDAHAHPAIHGGPRKAVLLIAAEVVDELALRGYPVFYGALGENLTTRGIAIHQLRIGDRLRAGSALLEITQPRGPCTALDVYGESLKREIYDARVKALDPSSARWGMSGFYARVLEPGVVRVMAQTLASAAPILAASALDARCQVLSRTHTSGRRHQGETRP